MSTFTDADHAKAVELYDRFKGAEWWPKNVHWKCFDGFWCWHDGMDEIFGNHALSAIAWAMVERFGMFTLAPHKDGGWMVIPFGVHEPTRFLALAAAVEGME